MTDQNEALQNVGGRKWFGANSRVRILELDGTVSSDIYKIEGDDNVRSDRKGHILLTEEKSGRQVRVHFRRVLPLIIDGSAPVIESGDKYVSLCPQCGNPKQVNPNDSQTECPQCGIFPLYWLGVRPMTTTAEKEVVQKTPKPKTEKKERPPRVVREPHKPDLAAIAALPNCELWTQGQVTFDHAKFDVAAHVLLYAGDNNGICPRKLCFNTYNGTTGKKGDELPIEGFLKGEKVSGSYTVQDIDKAREKLTKDGYTKGTV